MNNTYFQYKSFSELLKQYSEVFKLLEDSEGELTEEIEIKLKEAEENNDVLSYDILNIVDNLEKEKKLNKERIDNLTKKNKSFDNQIEHLEGIVKSLVKQKNKLNDSGNFTNKVGERSLTVKKYLTYEVTPEFKDPRFIKYSVSKIDPDHFQRVEKYFKDRNIEVKVDKTILKEELNKYLKDNDMPEGVEQIKKESLLKK